MCSLREINAMLLMASKNFNVGMHADMYNKTSFKFGTVLDYAVIYILIQVRVTLTMNIDLYVKITM